MQQLVVVRVHVRGDDRGRLVSTGPINLAVGDRLRIVPNHACVVTNMVDEVHLFSAAEPTPRAVPVVARGRIW